MPGAQALGTVVVGRTSSQRALSAVQPARSQQSTACAVVARRAHTLTDTNELCAKQRHTITSRRSKTSCCAVASTVAGSALVRALQIHKDAERANRARRNWSTGARRTVRPSGAVADERIVMDTVVTSRTLRALRCARVVGVRGNRRHTGAGCR